jgi:hypothetical protein
MPDGFVAHGPGSIAGLALINTIRNPARTVLGALSLAVGICALTVLLAITLGFHGAIVES